MNRSASTRLALVCISIAVVGLLAACSSGTAPGGTTSPGAPSGGATSAPGTTISEANFAFSPAAANMKAGDVVTFMNNDTVAHNVKIDGQELGIQNPGESKTWTAAKDGSYPYACVIHPTMTGQITVGAGGGASTNPPAGGTTGGSTGGGSGGYTPPSSGGY